MRCSDCVALIARKLDGTLTGRETKRLETHLAECGRCRAELVLQKKLVHALKKEISDGVSGDFTRRVTERTADLAGARRRQWFNLRNLLPAIPAVAAAILLVVFGKDLGALVAPGVEAVADVTGGPLAAFGDRVAQTLAGIPTVSDGSLPDSGILSRIFANLYVGISIACAAVVWAFSKAYTFVRD
jgi:anti-sigma factor RsiW